MVSATEEVVAAPVKRVTPAAAAPLEKTSSRQCGKTSSQRENGVTFFARVSSFAEAKKGGKGRDQSSNHQDLLVKFRFKKTDPGLEATLMLPLQMRIIQGSITNSCKQSCLQVAKAKLALLLLFVDRVEKKNKQTSSFSKHKKKKKSRS